MGFYRNRIVPYLVTSWTLCTIPDVLGALSEVRRVLRPGGQLLFVEHGLATDDKVRRWQNRLTPVWKRIAGGCHPNRPIHNLIEKAGFNITARQSRNQRGTHRRDAERGKVFCLGLRGGGFGNLLQTEHNALDSFTQ